MTQAFSLIFKFFNIAFPRGDMRNKIRTVFRYFNVKNLNLVEFIRKARSVFI
jgi:hypothetical protein